MKSRAVCLIVARYVVCFLLALSSVALAKKLASQNITQPQSYQVFTQRKGQSLSKAISSLSLNAIQKRLITTLPIAKAAKSDRQFHLGFVSEKGKSLLREIQVIRGKNRANFLIKLEKGKPVAKAVKKVANSRQLVTDKPKRTIVKPITLNEPKGDDTQSASKKISSSNTLIRKQFVQKKGQSLTSAVKAQKLSRIQQRLITTLPITKQAKSNRTFHLLFARENGRDLLREIKVVRGTNYADYRVEIVKGKAVAVSKTGEPPVIAKKQAQEKQQKKQKTIKQTASTNLHFDQYSVLKFKQNKGQSLSSAMRKAGLSSLQQKLMLKAPFTSKAKSTRYFYVLFERVGKSKLMRSFKVVRGGSRAQYAIIKHKGKLEIADSKGQISAGRTGMLRYPLSFSRVSSHFSYRRYHPILKRYQKHTGTDFAARRGTRIWAPASGVVTFRGWQRGYGRTVIINHGNGYKTKYAHLSRYAKGLRVGKRVSKKQIIAYVGNSGRSTGPHLHYEVIVNGKPRNPLRVALPGKKKIIRTKESQLYASRYLRKLNGLISQRKSDVRVAKKQ